MSIRNIEDEEFGPTNDELDELERLGVDPLIEDPSFSPVSDRIDEILEKQEEMAIQLERLEKMIKFMHAAFNVGK